MRYRCKMGTVPYADVVTERELKPGQRLWVPETLSFQPVEPVFEQPERYSGWASCLVEKVDGDVLFLTRF